MPSVLLLLHHLGYLGVDFVRILLKHSLKTGLDCVYAVFSLVIRPCQRKEGACHFILAPKGHNVIVVGASTTTTTAAAAAMLLCY
jgi:hypothetical protein